MKLQNSPYEILVKRYKSIIMNKFESIVKELIDQEWEVRISMAKGNKPRGTGYSTKEEFISSNTDRFNRNAQTLIDLMDHSDKNTHLP